MKVLKDGLNSMNTYVPFLHHMNILTKLDVQIDKCDLHTFTDCQSNKEDCLQSLKCVETRILQGKGRMGP